MGGGGSTQSTNKTTNTNTSGSSAISGDNLGTVLAGVNMGKGASINIKSTDHGAVKSAGDIAKAALLGNTAAMKEASDLGAKAIAANSETLGKAFDFGNSALKENSNMAQKAMAENGAVSRGAMDSMSKNTLFSLKENSDVNKNAMDNIRKNTENSTSAVKAMAAQSGENARAALVMAENTASRSQIGAAGEMSKVAIAVAVVLGLGVTVMAIKGAK
ncbi:MAG: hypothetical protein ACI935_002115 [Moritella dasanensis]|jgi:hypothetical protein